MPSPSPSPDPGAGDASSPSPGASPSPSPCPGAGDASSPSPGANDGKAGFNKESGNAASIGTKQIAQIRWSYGSRFKSFT